MAQGDRDAGPFGLFLDGWDRRSIWGFDGAMGGFWAQLWRNGEPDDPISDRPHVWIGSPSQRSITSPTMLLLRIVQATGRTQGEVDQAMVAGMPSKRAAS